jgi:hypothetical protein
VRTQPSIAAFLSPLTSDKRTRACSRVFRVTTNKRYFAQRRRNRAPNTAPAPSETSTAVRG